MYLIKNGLNPSSAELVASNYTETMTFVKEQTKDYNPSDESNDKPQQDNDKKHQTRGMKDYKIPLSTNTYVILSGPFPLDEPDWKQMITVLDLIKRGLVSANKQTKE